jgi:hypothetical protein
MSWTDGKTGFCWLKDIPNTIKDSARILTYGYDADTRGKAPLSTLSLYEHARSFVHQLSEERTSVRTTHLSHAVETNLYS